MTRKRFIKLLMAYGVQRNIAQNIKQIVADGTWGDSYAEAYGTLIGATHAAARAITLFAEWFTSYIQEGTP